MKQFASLFHKAAFEFSQGVLNGTLQAEDKEVPASNAAAPASPMVDSQWPSPAQVSQLLAADDQVIRTNTLHFFKSGGEQGLVVPVALLILIFCAGVAAKSVLAFFSKLKKEFEARAAAAGALPPHPPPSTVI